MTSVAEKAAHAELLKLRTVQVQRGAARAAVLGVNDGLVSTSCIILGVAAASGGSQHSVLLAGFAGLIAGAISMGIGEWISVRSQVELFQGILIDVKRYIKQDKELLEEQLQDNLVAAGFKSNTAKMATLDMAHDDDHLFDLYVSRVIGLNKNELGSPWHAALSSTSLFIAGALASLLPWFFLGGTTAALLSLIFTAIGAVIVGGYVARSSGRSRMFGAVRQLIIVVAASALTYGIGHLFGVAVG